MSNQLFQYLIKDSACNLTNLTKILSHWIWACSTKVTHMILRPRLLVTLTTISLGLGFSFFKPTTMAATCPAVTVNAMQGLSSQFPQQFELAEFERVGKCTIDYHQNPDIAKLNAQIVGNASLPTVNNRLPAEPLVVVPYRKIGRYGGVLTGLSKATEAGTSDLLSIRHVNLVRYSDDLKTIVPNVAKSWQWDDNFKQLTFTLRQGHKWSDGQPFTSEDIAFWYNDILLNPKITEKTPDRWLFGGKPAKVEVLDSLRVRFSFSIPQPNLLNRWAVDYGQTFQPKHFLSSFMDKYNPQAKQLRTKHGFKNEREALNFYYGGSDWKDVPSAMMKDAAKAKAIGRDVVPTLESHVLVKENTEGRLFVANAYFHMVDTAGNQLPYISEIKEDYVPEREVGNLRILNGQVVWKQQAIELNDFPLLKENEVKGKFNVTLAPSFGQMVFYSFNRNHKDKVLANIFSDIRFNQAMSLAMDREEIKEVVYLGQGNFEQAFPVEPSTVDFVPKQYLSRFTQYNRKKANALLDEMGLKRGSDGIRRRADGKPLSFRITFASQGSSVQLHELVQGYWSNLGIRVDVREVTTDEYRAQANGNDVDIFTWRNDAISAPTISQDVTSMVPPFGNFFNPGGGYEWVAWKQSGGTKGVKPPSDILRLWDLADEFLSYRLGSDKSNEIGTQIIKIHADNLLKIGVIANIPSPYIYHQSLQNVPVLTAKAYDFYWAYPYRPHQWYLVN